MKESDFKYSVHDRLDHCIEACAISSDFCNGWPDTCYFAPQGMVLWIEWKFVKEFPQRYLNLLSTSTPSLSGLQQDWLKTRHNTGHNVAVGLGTTHGGIILPGLSWQKHITREFFLENRKSYQQIAEWIHEQLGVS